ncbi:Glycerol-3-phosphate acyltransferase chloroplastic [Bienertia sinuspersici]
MSCTHCHPRTAVHSSGISNADEIVLSNMSTMLELVLLDMEAPFVFPPFHKAVREPIDYYSFGQNYIRPLIDFRDGNKICIREYPCLQVYANPNFDVFGCVDSRIGSTTGLDLLL